MYLKIVTKAVKNSLSENHKPEFNFDDWLFILRSLESLGDIVDAMNKHNFPEDFEDDAYEILRNYEKITKKEVLEVGK